MKKTLAFSLIASLLASAAWAEDQVTNLTIYGNSPQSWDMPYSAYNSNIPGYAVISFARQVSFSLGNNTIAVTSVPDEIDSSSIMIKSANRNLQVVEQNFISSKLDVDNILKQNIGHQVEVEKYTGNSAVTTKGTLLDISDGLIVKDGSNVKIIKDYSAVSVADNDYSSGNMIKWVINSSKASEGLFEYSYKTTGITWVANYNVYVDGEGPDVMARIEGWANLINNTNMDVKQTGLKLVAGEVAQDSRPAMVRPMMAMAKGMAMDSVAASAPSSMQEQNFSDYHMYTIDRKVDLPMHSSKKVKLFEDKEGVLAVKKFIYDSSLDQNSVKTLVAFSNDEKSHMGIPLPGGKYSVFAKDSSGVFEQIGEVTQEHHGENEKIELAVGNSFDLKARRAQTDSEQDNLRHKGKYTVTVEISNAMDKQVEVMVKEPINQQNWQIVSANLEYKKVNSNTVEFAMPIKSKDKSKLEYVVEYSW